MHAKTLQIVWHSKEPVFSVDFHPDGYIATAGQDKEVKLWAVTADAEGVPCVEYLSTLQGHAKTVNCVRFSPSGDCLASAGDSGEIYLWRPSAATASTPVVKGNLEEEGKGPVWRVSASLRGHHDDVLDLAWSPDGTALLSGSVENECMIFDVDAKKLAARIDGHRHYVQGVCWDPLGQYIITQSVDRSCRAHAHRPPPTGKKITPGAHQSSAALAKDFIFQQAIVKRTLDVPMPQTPTAGQTDTALPATATTAPAPATASHSPAHATTADPAAATPMQVKPKTAQQYLFHDESLNTFFRRLSWSPDGSFLAVPSGLFKQEVDGAPLNTTYVFARGEWSSPLYHLPSLSKPTVAVRFCPVIFQSLASPQAGSAAAAATAAPDATANADDSSSSAAAAAASHGPSMCSVSELPYRLVFAVATSDSVLLYHTESLQPFLLLGPLHYAPITDLAWSADGSFLFISSRDGYCSAAAFQPGELGLAVAKDDLPEGLTAALQKATARHKLQPATAASPSPPPQQQGAGASQASSSLAVAGDGMEAVASLAPVTPPASPKAVNHRPKSGGLAAQGLAAQGLNAATAHMQTPAVKRIIAQPVVAGVPQGAVASSGASATAARRRITPQPVVPSAIEEPADTKPSSSLDPAAHGQRASPSTIALPHQQAATAAPATAKRITPTCVSSPEAAYATAGSAAAAVAAPAAAAPRRIQAQRVQQPKTQISASIDDANAVRGPAPGATAGATAGGSSMSIAMMAMRAGMMAAKKKQSLEGAVATAEGAVAGRTAPSAVGVAQAAVANSSSQKRLLPAGQDATADAEGGCAKKSRSCNST
eukprot:jgi/Chrzof1/6631/Cz19g03120.t1